MHEESIINNNYNVGDIHGKICKLQPKKIRQPHVRTISDLTRIHKWNNKDTTITTRIIRDSQYKKNISIAQIIISR